ncbi:MAG: response regulator transcription factor [Acidimicrobiia bacterium]
MSVSALPPTVLVVEDEATIADAVAARLRSEGFSVEIAADGLVAIDAAARLQPDLVVLDLMLPGLDGLEVCRRIQSERPVPVLMLTARDTEADVLTGLTVGADDYMTKPFSARELVARVKAMLRRVNRAAELLAASGTQTITAGSVSIDVAQRRVYDGAVEVHLTPTEFDLLAFLASRPGTVCTREQLLAQVWGYDSDVGGRTVDSHVRALRRKLGDEIVRTVHGIGYSMNEGDPS